jgi:hypothetical protein
MNSIICEPYRQMCISVVFLTFVPIGPSGNLNDIKPFSINLFIFFYEGLYKQRKLGEHLSISTTMVEGGGGCNIYNNW